MRAFRQGPSSCGARGRSSGACAQLHSRLQRCAPRRSSVDGGRQQLLQSPLQPQRHSTRVCAAAASQLDEEDLMQFADRWKWYEAKFAADDMPDWNEGRFVASSQQGPGVRLVTFTAEVSRERVPLRNAYKAAGQQALLRVNGGEARQLLVASPPPPESLNTESLFLTKGDIFAGETKAAREPSSATAEVSVLVSKEQAPEVYDMGPDDLLSVGPFQGTGLDTRSSGLLGMFRFPTLVIFAAGGGIATAAALVESPLGAPTHLGLPLRADVRLFYVAPNRASLALTEKFDGWAERYNVTVVPTTAGFMDAWDEDDSLVYDPATTAAIVLTAGDEEAEAAALAVCREAEITTVVTDSAPARPPVYLDSTPKSFLRWRKDPAAVAAAAAAAAAAGAGANGATNGAASSEDLTA